MARRGESDPSYRLSCRDLQIVAAALLKVLPRAVKEETVTLLDLLRAVGGPNLTEQTSRLAMALSGSGGRSGTAYRTQRRAIERHPDWPGRPGRQVRGKTKKGRAGALQRFKIGARRPHLPGRAALDVTIIGSPYGAPRSVTMPAGAPQHMSTNALAGVRAALRDGDTPPDASCGPGSSAARALLDAWVFAYKLAPKPGADGVVGPIDAAEIELIE